MTLLLVLSSGIKKGDKLVKFPQIVSVILHQLLWVSLATYSTEDYYKADEQK